MKTIKCFISYTYNKNQEDFAKIFAQRLKRFKGIETWLDKDKILVSDHLMERLERGLKNETDCCIVLLSPEYLQAKNAPKELHLASDQLYSKGKPLFIIRIKSMEMPIEIGDLLWKDFSDSFVQDRKINNQIFTKKLRELVRSIRSKFSLSDIEEFFTPLNGGKIYIASNKTYQGPYPDQKSSTNTFAIALYEVLFNIKQKGRIESWEIFETDYSNVTKAKNLIKSNSNIISYASSKINKVTELILNEVSKKYKIETRFVMERDLKNGVLHSNIKNEEPKSRIALLWNSTPYFHDDKFDHGIIMKLRTDEFTWWIIAGCGRPASMAARKLLFEPDWNDRLWNSLRERSRDSFIASFSVEHNREKDPSYIGRIIRFEIEWLSKT